MAICDSTSESAQLRRS